MTWLSEDRIYQRNPSASLKFSNRARCSPTFCVIACFNILKKALELGRHFPINHASRFPI
jgi:hypothetical protein